MQHIKVGTYCVRGIHCGLLGQELPRTIVTYRHIVSVTPAGLTSAFQQSAEWVILPHTEAHGPWVVL